MSEPRVKIIFCAQCHFVLRAGWLAQELLSTFGNALGEVALEPGTGGIFEIHLGEECIFSRQEAGRFPEAKELKQLIRDRIDPERDLGHSDKK